MGNDILVLAEHTDGTLKGTAFELLTAARTLTAASGGQVHALALGTGAGKTAGALAEWGAASVLTAEGDAFAQYASLRWARAVRAAADAKQPAAVLMSVSALTRDLAGRAAARLGGPLASDCTGLTAEGGGFQAVRPMYAGRAVATLQHGGGTPLVATLRPNSFDKQKPDAPGAGVVEALDVAAEPADLRALVKEVASVKSERPELTEASIVVSGGRSLGSEDNFKLIYDFADALGAAPGASRAAVDAGYAPHSMQVGQTGKTVSPALYFAVGISGAIQHLAGMRTSKYIVAINKNPDEPIFKLADYGIVGDLFEVLPALTAECKQLLGS